MGLLSNAGKGDVVTDCQDFGSDLTQKQQERHHDEKVDPLVFGPSTLITTAADMTEAVTLTSSLPIRMVMMSRRGWLSRRWMRSNRGCWSRRICSICVLLSEKRAVSELEKKPENTIMKTNRPTSSHKI